MTDLNARINAVRLVLALRQEGVRDPRIMEALEQTPRDLFVPAPFREHAWENIELPIDCGQTMTRPVMIGQVVEALELRREHSVLEIGVGSGYPAAVMSRLARRVVSLERYRTLLERARQTHVHLGLLRTELYLADGTQGYAEHAPYDRVVIWGSAPRIPPAVLDQLAPHAIVIAPVQRGETQAMIKFEIDADGSLVETVLMKSLFTPLEPSVAKRL